uniref:VP4 n=1 Tax=Periparus ater ambidensovirus TaxID=2794455 RepID=A0A8A4XDI0_9VIRU|nr:MAG: VP4 [Periparus ater ambidensovirus]
MPPGNHKGQTSYAYIEKRFSELWKLKHKFEKSRLGGYQKWKKSEEGQQIRAQATRDFVREHGKYTKASESTSARLNEGRPPPDRPIDRGSPDLFTPSGESSSGPDIDRLLADFPSSSDISPDMADIQNNMPNAPSASSVAAGGGASDMDTSPPMEGGAGGSGATSGGLAVGAMHTIIPNPRLKSGHMTFQKVWYKYTYGLANSVIKLPTPRVVRYTTPYAYYPVDWLPYYMSPAEYTCLPNDSRVVKVSATITPIGTRTAFDHGTTLSGTATTEYVPIVKHAIGLNTQLYIENRSVQLKSTEPMMVEGFSAKSLEDHYKSMYHFIGALEVPRHLNWYANILYNDNSENGFDGLDLQTQYRIDKVFTTHIINHKLGQPIVNYEYTPNNGYCKPSKRNFLIDYNTTDGFPADVTNTSFPWKKVLPSLVKMYPIEKKMGRIGVNKKTELASNNFVNKISTNYYQSVEGMPFVDIRGSTVGSYTPQPQVHLGLLATPALNPATETKNFLNSSLYTVTKTECIVSFDLDSMCVSGQPYCWPKDTKFFTDQDATFYGYGYTNFGTHATTSGRLERTPENSSTFPQEGNKKHGIKRNKYIDPHSSKGRDRIKRSLIKDFSEIELDEIEFHENFSDLSE